MLKILVPIDFSVTSGKAFRFALSIAEKMGSTVILFHVYTAPLSNRLLHTSKNKAQDAQTEGDLLNRVLQFNLQAGEGQDKVPVSCIVDHGPVVDTIISFTSRQQVSMIVMGTQGASGLKKVIIGSVAEHCMQKSEIPVLLIPEKFEPGQINQVAFMSNFDKTDNLGLRLTIDLARLYSAEVTVVHLRDQYTQFKKEEGNQDFVEYALILQRIFNDYDIKFKELTIPEVEEAMESLAHSIPYDLLVMVRRNKSVLENFFIESFTRQMAHVTTKPLLIVPELE